MRNENFKIKELVEDLQGTCSTINEKLPEGMTEDELTEEEYDYIDQEIFCCETCGWWFESGDEDQEGNCSDCSIEDEED